MQVHAIETVGGIWLGTSAVTFIVLGVFVEIRRRSRTGLSSERRPHLDLVAKTDKKAPSKKAPSREAA
jgi:hypothetical protein